jgi:hypothetical protein
VRQHSGPRGSGEFVELQPKHGLSTQTIFVKGKWGLLDATGAWIRRPEFSDIELFDRAQTDLMWVKADAGWGLIKPDGTWLVEPTFERVGQLVDDRAPVWLGGRIGYVDRTGRVVIAPKFDDGISFFHFIDGLPAPAKLGRYFGLIDRSGEWVVQPTYDHISPRWAGSESSVASREFKGFSAELGNQHSVLDKAGKVVISAMKLKPSTSRSTSTSSGGISITTTL